MPRARTLAALFCCLLTAATATARLAPRQQLPTEPQPLGRVLITNDDGVDSPGLHALVAAFAEVAEVTVVAPAADASGTADMSVALRQRQLTVHQLTLPDGHPATAVEGNPADAVLVAIRKLMAPDGPDLVVSGINTGPNLAAAHIFSGTIGAARVAGFLGVPAIAVSGGSAQIPGQLEAAARYTVALARSEAFASLGRYQYLTLSVPLTSPAKFAGVRVARRHMGLASIGFTRTDSPRGQEETYRLRLSRETATPEPDSDSALYERGYLVVVPMTIAEDLRVTIEAWSRVAGKLPPLEAAKN
ncbi:MAG: 5'/3'-nucleotidase SurE [Acidobacteriota bacterium]